MDFKVPPSRSVSSEIECPLSTSSREQFRLRDGTGGVFEYSIKMIAVLRKSVPEEEKSPVLFYRNVASIFRGSINSS